LMINTTSKKPSSPALNGSEVRMDKRFLLASLLIAAWTGYMLWVVSKIWLESR
jgi:hypothetical protein